jgi:hypothetical protein
MLDASALQKKKMGAYLVPMGTILALVDSALHAFTQGKGQNSDFLSTQLRTKMKRSNLADSLESF